ncbi:MAG TPA: enoyl-CoA hydratase/isomerase family protein [Acidimicrobiales bacterium]
MPDDELLYRVENGVAWITLNRPEFGNAMTPTMRDGLRDIVESFNGGHEVRAAVITGAGDKMFCPGADIRMDRTEERPPHLPERVVGEARRMMLNGQLRLMPAILDCEIPIIAAVNGTAAGVGAHLALCCDLVIMAEHAKFIEVFARRGLVPDGLGCWILPRLVGLQRAKELVFFAEDIPAARAEQLGLCNKVVPKDQLLATAKEWAERLASGPTKSYMFSKWLINRSLDVDRRTIIEEEAWAVELITHTDDAKEGVASFVERRAPRWKGF